MQKVKVVVAGAFDAGKTQFITTISEIPPVRTERRVTDATSSIKPLTTAAMDFGRITMREDLALHLYGTPGQWRFDFMWSALARGMRAVVFVVDSTRPETFADSRRILDYFLDAHPTPYLIAANKQDHPNALEPEALRRRLRVPESIRVMPCVATNYDSVRRVLDDLLDQLPLASAETPDEAVVRATPLPQPHAPARVVAVSLSETRRKRHLSRGDAQTLCGRPISPDAVPVLIFGADDCQVCARRAQALGLACRTCGRPLTRSNGEGLCLGCAQRRATSERDLMALDSLDLNQARR